jgi:hypothetical protein
MRGLRILSSDMDILTETQNLLQRFQQGGAFRTYLRQRQILVIPAVVIFLAFSVATAAGTVITLGGTRSFLVLVGMLLAPVVLLGSLFVQLFVFFQWLENRAIAQATHHAPQTAKDDLRQTLPGLWKVIKAFPAVVLAIGAALLFGPLVLLWQLSGAIAILMLFLLLATPAAYAALDR